ncbi:HesA/MoeB/ThiF family protein [Streptomyces chiangmaiensis]|uniref:ThiF family adenylyltransferase n=1 Tax=Streptomyces chiangmaiensis TaxID=766497 RepID=A0ABU7FLP6_9ACTN|nr:ThiF family adenylyltransferase [Streptomyces chiangmaiensis]MED7825045.1 ThiF family adenylyltransferase [Streptomyces chiangmaiensis]
MTAPAHGIAADASDMTGAQFYDEFTIRNTGVVPATDQDVLRRATVLVAGCGSIGGSAIEPLARLGVQRFVLADPGTYELNNLNRQNATLADLGRNKAEVAAERIRAINPHAEVLVFPDGVTSDNVKELTADCEAVVDGVDVTTMSGWRAKLQLHHQVAERRLPLVTGWDMAGAQYVRCYDYRKLRRVLDGALVPTDLDRLSTWELLRRLLPVRFVPGEMLQTARANFRNPDFAFPQVVHSAMMFGAISAHTVTQLLNNRPVRAHIYVDVHQRVRPTSTRLLTRLKWPLQAVSLLADLRSLADKK